MATAAAAISTAGLSSHMAKRLTRELAAMGKEQQADVGIKVQVPAVLSAPWRAYMRGPPDTPFEGCVYAVRLTIGPDYPHGPPTVMFENRCWHPNIGVNGHVCVDILKSHWSASLTLLKLLQSVQSLLDDPDPSSPLNGHAADMVRNAKATGDWTAYRQAIVASQELPYPLTEDERAFAEGRSVVDT
jgi:ubiquitin-protein ligase